MLSRSNILKTATLLTSTLFLCAFQNCSFDGQHDDSSSLGGVVGWSVDPELNMQAINILRVQCAGCHGGNGQGGVSNITDVNHLINSGLISPGDSSLGRIMGSIEDGSMPPGGNIDVSQRNTLKSWIDSFTQSEGGGGLPMAPPPIPLEATFASIQANILIPKCVACHRTGDAEEGVNYETYELTLQTGKITPGNVEDSEMYDECANGTMPEAPYELLTNQELLVLRQWIDQGALNN